MVDTALTVSNPRPSLPKVLLVGEPDVAARLWNCCIVQDSFANQTRAVYQQLLARKALLPAVES